MQMLLLLDFSHVFASWGGILGFLKISKADFSICPDCGICKTHVWQGITLSAVFFKAYFRGKTCANILIFFG